LHGYCGCFYVRCLFSLAPLWQRIGAEKSRLPLPSPHRMTATMSDVWIPYPVSNNEQDISNVRINGNFTQSGVYGEKETGNPRTLCEWATPNQGPAITLTFDATARELIKRDFPAVEPAIPVEINEYLKSTDSFRQMARSRKLL